MTWRGVAPVQLVIVFVGSVLMLTTLGIITLAIAHVPVPDALGTLSIASMTALAGLLAPNTGLVSSRAAKRAEAAGHAAATAVIEADAEAEAVQVDHDQAVQLGNSHDKGLAG